MKNNIKELRKKLGLSQVEAAKLAGWGQSRWSSYETGAKEPGLTAVITLLTVLSGKRKRLNIEDVFVV